MKVVELVVDVGLSVFGDLIADAAVNLITVGGVAVASHVGDAMRNGPPSCWARKKTKEKTN